jgi:hypothetical protein
MHKHVGLPETFLSTLKSIIESQPAQNVELTHFEQPHSQFWHWSTDVFAKK